MRPIDADALIEALNEKGVPYRADVQAELDNAPTIDAVPVVQCKECKHCEYASNRIPTEQAWVCYKLGIDVEQDWFCADGEKKDDDKSCDTCKHYDKWWDDIVCDGCTKAHSNWERKEMMTQEEAMNMSNEQAVQILIPMRNMMCDQNGCPISDAVFALDKAIESLSADVAPVRHGHWIEYGENEDGTHNICCSICDGFIKSKGHANSCYTRNKYRYCHNCGARMDEEIDDK